MHAFTIPPFRKKSNTESNLPKQKQKLPNGQFLHSAEQISKKNLQLPDDQGLYKHMYVFVGLSGFAGMLRIIVASSHSSPENFRPLPQDAKIPKKKACHSDELRNIMTFPRRYASYSN